MFLCGAGSLALYIIFLTLHPAFLFVSTWILSLTTPTSLVLQDGTGGGVWLELTRFLYHHDPARSAVFATLLVALCALYLTAYGAVRRGARISFPVIVIGSLLFAAVLSLGLPVFSADIFGYLLIGEVADTGSINPYDVHLDEIEGLEAKRYAPPLRRGALYGPFAVRLFQLLHVEAFGPLGNLAVFRVFFLGCLAASLALTIRFLRRLELEDSQVRALVLLLAWNPLVLIEGVLNGHVDSLVMVMLSGGILLLVSGRWMLGVGVVAAVTSVKVTFAFLLPALLAFTYRRGGGGVAGVFRVVAVGAAAAAFFLVWLLPDWLGANPLGPLGESAGWASTSLAFVLKHLGRPLGIQGLVPWVLGVAFAAVLLARLGRVRTTGDLLARLSRDVLLYLLFFVPWLKPWYLLAAFPTALTARRPHHVQALVLFSVLFPVMFYGLRLGAGEWSPGLQILVYVLGVLPPSLLFVVREWQTRSR